MTAYTIIGTPFSTYTRAVTLGLVHRGIPFEQVRVVPHSDTARAHHPFGFLPTLLVRDGEGNVVWTLCESQAIARYIDRIQAEPRLDLAAIEGQGDSAPLPAERVWEFVSLAGAHGFPAIEKGVVKPYIAALDAPAAAGTTSQASATAAAQAGLPALARFLAQIESRMVPLPLDAYALGATHVTWADFFLYPLIADLRAVEAGLGGGEGQGGVLSERLRGWMDRMDKLEAVKQTSAGTLGVGARPP